MNRQRHFGQVQLAVLILSVALAGASAPSPSAPPPSTTWPAPDVNALQAGPWKDTVQYGHALFSETPGLIGPEVAQPAMRFAGNNLSCQSCHLKGGTQQFGLPLIGVYGLFPTYIARENEVRTLEDRIEGCLERSMNGRPLPVDGREMKALVAYLQFLSTGIPVGRALDGRGTPRLPLLSRAADPARGATVFLNRCAACHQLNGLGMRNPVDHAKGYLFPPLWGPDSFNDGAGMHRLIASASFIRATMPLGTTYDKPVLSVEEAWDVAAYVNSQPRPAKGGLDRDYPDRKRKPVDAPFPPFLDSFPLEQHRFGPFQPILANAPRSSSP
jgi:thiosulfate dehydrogenase